MELEEEEQRFAPLCLGCRLRPEALAVSDVPWQEHRGSHGVVGDWKRSNFSQSWKFPEQQLLMAGPIIKEMREKLGFLTRVGLEYVSLDRRNSHAFERGSPARPAGQPNRGQAAGHPVCAG